MEDYAYFDKAGLVVSESSSLIEPAMHRGDRGKDIKKFVQQLGSDDTRIFEEILETSKGSREVSSVYESYCM